MRRAVLVLTCALALAACGQGAEPAAPEPPQLPPEETPPTPAQASARPAPPPPDPPPIPVRAAPVLEGRWELLDYGGAPATTGLPAWVEFRDGRVTGWDGCTDFSGRYTQNGKLLKVTGVAAASSGCKSDYDRWRSRVLRRALSTAKDFSAGAGMTLYGPHGSMNFVRPTGAAPAPEDRRLEGVWRMLTLAGEPVKAIGDNRPAPTLRFEKGAYQWSIGCNSHSGFYRMEAGDRVLMRGGMSTQAMCSYPEERLMARTIGGRTAFRRSGDTLVLETPSGPLVLEKTR